MSIGLAIGLQLGRGGGAGSVSFDDRIGILDSADATVTNASGTPLLLAALAVLDGSGNPVLDGSGNPVTSGTSSDGALHNAETGTALHEPFHYVAASDPGAVGASKYWLDTTADPYRLKRRNAGDSAWVVVL